MFSVVLVLAALGQCGSQGCPSPGGGLPSMPVFFPATPVYVQPSQPVIAPDSGLTPAQIEAAKGDFDLNPTFHYGPGTVLVRDQFGNLVPSHLPTHVSYPGEAMQPYVHGKQYPPRKSASKPAVKDDGKKGQGCPNANCKCLAPCACFQCKCDHREAVGQTLNFGIDEKKLAERAGRNRYTTNNGKEITKADTNRLFNGDNGLPDDAGYDMLAVIGTQEQCEKVRKDVDSDPAFASLRDKLLVQCYQPDDEMIKRKGFAPGSPAIYLQDSNGKTKWREVEYRGPKVLAGEIDKRRPDNDPNKDPGPHNPGPSPLPSLQGFDLNKLLNHPFVWIIAVVLGLRFIQPPQPVKA